MDVAYFASNLDIETWRNTEYLITDNQSLMEALTEAIEVNCQYIYKYEGIGKVEYFWENPWYAEE